MADPVRPSRKLLEDVFKNPDLVRRVEKLFEMVGDTLPDQINNISTTINNTINEFSTVIEVTSSAVQNGLANESKINVLNDLLQGMLDTVEMLVKEPKNVVENFAYLDWIRFNKEVDTANYAGVVRWNTQDRCLEYVTGIGNVVQVGQEIWDNGVNKTGGTAADGKCVYANGVQGQRLTYDFADARDGDKLALIGVVTASTANNEEGPLTKWGIVHDLDTSAWVDGTKLYVAADGSGDLVSTAPSAPDFRIWVATVIYQHATQGQMFVAPRLDFANGVTLETLHVRETFSSGDMTGGDYLELEDTGFLEAHGDGRNWDDVYPAAISLSQGASGASESNYTGNFYAPEFVGIGVAKNLIMHFQIYHSYDEGSDINLHLHLYIPDDGTGGDIKFSAEYQWANVGGTGAYSSTTISNTATIGASAGVYQNYLFDIGDITGTGKTISSILSVVLTRDPTDVADTFGSSVWLLSADLHIHKNTLGSRQETSK